VPRVGEQRRRVQLPRQVLGVADVGDHILSQWVAAASQPTQDTSML
jgi:hypothetical protein